VSPLIRSSFTGSHITHPVAHTTGNSFPCRRNQRKERGTDRIYRHDAGPGTRTRDSADHQELTAARDHAALLDADLVPDGLSVKDRWDL
jgi:hypothetical protein